MGVNVKKSDNKKMDSAKSTGTAMVKKDATAKLPVAKNSAKLTSKAIAKPNLKAANGMMKATGKVEKAKIKLAANEKIDTSAKQKIKKQKLVRDSFTMPEAEYAVLGDVKKLCLKAGVEVKKSELLRIGVAHIRTLKITDLKKAIASLTPLKAGRPKKEK
jgi:hypothetical protein